MKKFRFCHLEQVMVTQGSFVMPYRGVMDVRYVQLLVKSCAGRELRKRMVLKIIMMIMRCYWRRRNQIAPILQ